VNYSFSPERFSEPNPEPDFLFNRPLIASYGAYYRMPFGDPESVEDALRRSQAYGFDEATRQFRLPPAGSRSDVYFFGNAAKLDTGVQFGPSRVVSQSAGASITAQDTGRNLVAIESAGARMNLPFALSDTRRLSVSWGLEARRLGLESFNTNNFTFTATYTNSQGTQTLRSDSASPQPARRQEFMGIPLTAGLDFSQTDKFGSSSASLALTYNLAGSGSDYDAIAYSPVGGAHFGKAALSLIREQRLPGGYSALLRSGGQIATGPLLFNEQFAVGGMNTVRGYFEGDSVADAGWNLSGEIRTPQWAVRVPVADTQAPAWLRGLVFMDFGQVYPMVREALVNRRDLWSAGVGVSASLNNTLDLKVTVGWPLIDSVNSQRGEPRANLSVGGQF
jgi:hemolysin activation/secretion protein